MRLRTGWLQPTLLAVIAAVVTAGAVGMRFLPVAWATTGMPPRPADAASTPLASPAVAPAGEGGYTFMMTQENGDPVRWDPCRPIHVVINDEHAPPGGSAVLQRSLDRISELTGLVFTVDGPTQERPSADRASMQPELYGNRWAPVLVAWASPEQTPGLAGDVAGYAGPMALRDGPGQPLRYMSGQVVLDGPQLGRILAGNAGVERTRAVLLHELAHLVGLEHVEDDTALMYPATSHRVSDFTPGDLRGLAAVSGGQCFS